MTIRTIHRLDRNGRIEDDTWDDSVMDLKAKQLIQSLKGKKYELVQSVKLERLVWASKWFDRELGVSRSPKGDLFAVIQGRAATAGTAGLVRPSDGPQGYRFILHVHPTLASTRSHFAQDLQAAGPQIEAVVDWNGRVIVFNDDGVKNDRPDGRSYAGLQPGDPHWPDFINTNRIIC